MDISIMYHDKYGTFNFDPFVPDLTAAKVRYLNYVWNGYKSVQIRIEHNRNGEDDKIVWETKTPVFPKWEENPELGF